MSGYELSEKARKKKTTTRILGNIGLFLLVFTAALPVLWLTFLSTKTNNEILTAPLSLPQTIQWINYGQAINKIPFATMIKNTVIVLFVAVPISMAFSILAAFALGRMKLGRLTNSVYSYFVFGVIMPVCVLILPIYLLMVKLNLFDTLWATILPHIGWAAPMNMMIMVAGFRNVPDSLEEAAVIDGCNIWQVLIHILIPVTKPVISTAFILTFLSVWNDFPLAKIMLNSPEVRTISIAAAYFKGTYSTNYALMTAGCVILILPQLLIFVIFQRFIIDGVTAGAVKE